MADCEIYFWDVKEKRFIQRTDGPVDNIEDIKISWDGSKVFSLHWISIQVGSIWTGEVLGMVELDMSIDERFLSVDGSRVWIHSSVLEFQGWDFEVPESPVQLSDIPPSHINNSKLWDVHLSQLIDAATGKVIFQPVGKFECPFVSQWDGQYLAAGYESGEVLILDFNHILFE